MVNLIAERDVVSELVQSDFTPERVVAEMRRLLPEGNARQTMSHDFEDVRRRLASGEAESGASDQAAAAVFSVLERPETT
jgi:lipid-A-disaccharide synthase